MNNHRYKIGQKVKHIQSGRDFYIIGIKTDSGFGLSETKLVIHSEKNKPSRHGYTVWPIHIEVIEDEKTKEGDTP